MSSVPIVLVESSLLRTAVRFNLETNAEDDGRATMRTLFPSLVLLVLVACALRAPLGTDGFKQGEQAFNWHHLLEYPLKTSHIFNKEGSLAGEKWVLDRLSRVLAGEATQVAAGIRRSTTKRAMKARTRKRGDQCADCLSKYAAHLRYDEYLALGLPIASGVIEGACRHLIGDRLYTTGARWSLAGTEAMLKLRALWSSGDFEEYWSLHDERELKRNHRSQYAVGYCPNGSLYP